MTLSSGASTPAPLTEDQRLAAAGRLRRFGYILLAAGAAMGVAGIAAWAFTSNPVFLLLLVTAAFDVALALWQFAAARKV